MARCKAQVYRRDTYRVNRGPSRDFKMHYDRGQCRRSAGEDGFCTQHSNTIGNVMVYRYAEDVAPSPTDTSTEGE